METPIEAENRSEARTSTVALDVQIRVGPAEAVDYFGVCPVRDAEFGQAFHFEFSARLHLEPRGRAAPFRRARAA